MQPVIQITRNSFHLNESPADLSRLREQFQMENYVRLPGLFAPELLQDISRRIDAARFFTEVNKAAEGVEFEMDDPAALHMLLFLVNNPRLFVVIREISGCAPIGSFLGRVYRMMPGAGHYDTWHDDLVQHRMVAMSVNLSPQPYSGGVLQFRPYGGGPMLRELANTGLGDAILFHISRDLEHRVTEVVGTAPKTAFAGWYRSEPDFHATIRQSSGGQQEAESPAPLLEISAPSKGI